jgi:hypothetical protein
VLDFGSNLCVSYFNAVKLFGDQISSWSVVELLEIVALGSERYADERLSFHQTLQAA